MKKVFYLAVALCFAFAMQSCDEASDVTSSFERSFTVNVNIDMSLLANDSIPVPALKVQTLAQSVDYNTDSCVVKVFENGKPQIIAVTDPDNKLLMLYRGPVTENATITIDAASTAIAMVTFNPLFGPVPAVDYNSLTATIQGASQYADYRAAIDDAITRRVDLTATTNNRLIAMLYNLLRELCENAFSGLESIDASAMTSNSFFNCFPLIASTSGNTLTLRTSSNCPTYYGSVLDGQGNVVKFINVPAAQRYGFMDNFSGSTGENSLGQPVDIAFTNEGSYSIVLSCDDQSALLDLYTRLGNNVLAALGADIQPALITLFGPAVKKALEKEGIDLGEISNENLMEFVSTLYDGVVEFLASEENRALAGDANWNLASSLLVRLITVYTEIRETTDALLRTSWNVGQENNLDTIALNVNYGNGEIRPLDKYDIVITNGNNQTGTSYSQLDAQLSVRVREFREDGPHYVSGKTVQFVVTTGGGTMVPGTTTTSSGGSASARWFLGGGVSGDVQTAYAVVVEDGVEVSPRAYFNALISNDRYRCSLCCDWADHNNWASQWDIDFAVSSDQTGVVPLFNASGRQWDYNGMAERYEMSGTINTDTRYVDMDVAMYLTDPYYTGGTDIHYRTDKFQFTLQGSGIQVASNIIWDGHDYGQEWGAGCGVYIWLEQIISGTQNANKKAPSPKRMAKGQQGLASYRAK